MREHAQWLPLPREAPSKRKLDPSISRVLHTAIVRDSRYAIEIMRLSVDLDPDTLHNVCSQQLSSNSANVHARNDCDRIFLPFAIPVQRDWHRASPCADQRAQCHAIYFVQGQLEAGRLHPNFDIETVNVEQLWGREEAEV